MYSKELFCEKLREIRKEKGWSSKKLSLMLGQSETYISTLESKAFMPSVTTFFKICDLLKVSPCEFFSAYTQTRNVQTVVDDLRALSDEDFALASAFVRWLNGKSK